MDRTESLVTPGELWRPRNESVPWQVIGSEDGLKVELTGPGPLRGIASVAWETFFADWVYVEPSTESTMKVIDRCMQAVLKERESYETEEQATEVLRAHLKNVQGHLPRWMAPTFWKVEFDVMRLPKSAKFRVQNTAYTAIPTVLSGKKVEFYPINGESVKVVLPEKDIWVNSANAFEGVVALARLVEARGR
jgi:hypothetical protein